MPAFTYRFSGAFSGCSILRFADAKTCENHIFPWHGLHVFSIVIYHSYSHPIVITMYTTIFPSHGLPVVYILISDRFNYVQLLSTLHQKRHPKHLSTSPISSKHLVAVALIHGCCSDSTGSTNQQLHGAQIKDLADAGWCWAADAGCFW